MKLLYRLLRTALLPYYRAEQNKPKTHKDLTYAFTDDKGKRYYRYPDELSMPIIRYNKLQEYVMWMSSKLSADQLTLLVNKALEIISEGVKQGKNASAVAGILYQIKERKDKVIPHELVLNMLAIQYVREDETPTEIDDDIQREKVAAFKRDSELQDSFFFDPARIKKINQINDHIKKRLDGIFSRVDTGERNNKGEFKNLFVQLLIISKQESDKKFNLSLVDDDPSILKSVESMSIKDWLILVDAKVSKSQKN